ncbi:MAG: signal recognition particle-docking protein FtsY [Methanobrevibacter sp.]|uniref:signal recognition particle-docking protein FtsY n=1 Tax=Methanobrevibacter sp. TaxID=66852 RepID=UPI0026DEFEE9|nr:signal recognition particle-docking protein FtsY [Methanobrevibacter sp.]MDO5848523.1 signal recognition particle-docking protein FtsY [Methanobrevibacter sp.]
MFESLKKKFSRTSDKLEEELKEEAKQENNISDEEPQEKKRSFFSFGRKKKEEKPPKEEVTIPQLAEEATEIAQERIDEVAEEEEKEEKRSFFSFGHKKKEEEKPSQEEPVEVEEELPVEEEESPEVEEEEEADEDDEKEEKSRFSFFKRNKSDEDKAEEPVEEEISTDIAVAEDEEEISTDIAVAEDEDEEKEEKSRFSFGRKKKDDGEESSGGIFSFIREKTITENHVEDILWELEMGLLEGDVAMEVATNVVESVKNDLVGKKIKRSNDITEYTFNALKDAVANIIDIPGKSMTEMIEEKNAQGEPLVVMFVGINGTGKTTTIGKLANYYLKKGYDPVIAASDTFRAGAIEQVTHHADNVGVKIIKHQKGSDPAAVAFDAVEHAKAKGKELVLIDTAGRMQTNTNLMDEMKKIKRVSNPDLVVFVGDALTGNDATEQAVKFNDAIDIDGVILTKADADSKGGASLSIGYVIKKPILFLGMGQGYDDIKEYDAEWMLNQLFSDDEEEDAFIEE